ncbi:MAG: transcription termination factor Rho, partial [Verrucomicrobiia bacterium]
MPKSESPPEPAPEAPQEEKPTPKPASERELNLVEVDGILDIDKQNGGNGVLLDLKRYGKRRPDDTFVPKELIRRFKLRQGSQIKGKAFPAEGRFPNPKMRFIDSVDGLSIEDRKEKWDFLNFTSLSPEEKLNLETKDGRITTRAIDLFCPIGKGTRGLVVAPPRTGKTTLLRDIALGVIENHPECH